jgi:hypothetical protein
MESVRAQGAVSKSESLRTRPLGAWPSGRASRIDGAGEGEPLCGATEYARERR